MKYSLTKNTISVFGRTLFQIKAEVSFGSVVKGELGGYIEKEENLSQDGDAWVYENARVFGNARISGNARVYENAWVYENARVYDDAKVCGNAKVSGNAKVYDNAWICGNAKVCGDAEVCGNAEVCGKLKLLAGLFFGWKRKEEQIFSKSFGDDSDYEVVYKGEAEFGDEEDEEIETIKIG